MKNSNYSDWPKEDLVKENKKLKKRKKYGIVWDEEKTKEKFDKDSVNKLPILKEIKSKEIQTDENSPTNILIEGDNYHSLSVLNYTHAKRVDVIDGYSKSLNIDKFDLVIDWGFLYFITKPLFFGIDYFFKLLGNYGQEKTRKTTNWI